VAASGLAGRRSLWPTLLITAGFVVGGPQGAPLFVAGPLLFLLLISRPARREEWLWIVATALVIGLMLRGAPTLVEQTSRSAAVCFTGAFVVMTLLGIRSLSSRLILATTIAALVTLAWCAHLGIQFGGLRAALVTDMWESYRAWVPTLPPTPMDRATIDGLAASARDSMPAKLSANVQSVGDLYPGTLALGALVGGWLAWTWYHRISEKPIGAPPRPISALRFNDQLVWALIAAFGLTLFKVPEPLALVGSNVLLVLGALYWARGMAITRYAMAMLPAPPLFKVAVTALLVLPLAFGGWLLMGVADTWLDIRRRLQPPQGVLP
jgi:hypothetical protein